MKNIKKIFLIVIAIILGFSAGYCIKFYLETQNTVKVYFVKYKKSSDIELVPVKRRLEPDSSKIDMAISSLLKGPTKTEKEKGYYTEIPESTTLNSIEQTKDKIVINLTRNFEYGGGSSSLITRTNQLIRTASVAAGKTPVYLQLDGEQIDVLGGEGIIIEQPINEKEVR